MRYRIGEVAEFFGMTKEGIRYLERQGIIASVRDERNGYRYFPREAITRLKQIRRFQGLGFSLEEAQQMVCQTPREGILDKLDEKMKELEEKEEQIARMKALLQTQREVTEQLMDPERRIRLGMRPEMYFFPRVSDEASGATPEEKEAIAKARSVEKEWIRATPPCTLGAMHQSVREEKPKQFGSIVRAESARSCGLTTLPDMVFLPSCLCVCGVVEARLGEHPDISSLIHYADQHGLTVCDDIYGVLWLNYQSEDGKSWRVHEFFVPVCEKRIQNT